jgi:hypothetical protein
VRRFTAEVFERNRERNRRLLAELGDALGALNAGEVEPVLLKGAALWASLGRPAAFDRMLNDLDLLVAPAEAPRAVVALQTAGFEVLRAHAGPEVHVVAELGRASDVGAIDLHQRPPGPPGLAEVERLRSHCRPLDWRGLRAWVPEPALQVFFLVLHDQFHDGDYWRGGFTLRHLFDIAALTRGAEPVDFDLLDRLARTRLARHALEAELIAAHRIAGAVAPKAVLRRAWPRLQQARQLAQFAWPWLRTPLAALGLASEWPSLAAHRAADQADRRRLFGRPKPPPAWTERLDRLRDIFGGFAAGKI